MNVWAWISFVCFFHVQFSPVGSFISLVAPNPDRKPTALLRNRIINTSMTDVKPISSLPAHELHCWTSSVGMLRFPGWKASKYESWCRHQGMGRWTAKAWAGRGTPRTCLDLPVHELTRKLIVTATCARKADVPSVHVDQAGNLQLL